MEKVVQCERAQGGDSVGADTCGAVLVRHGLGRNRSRTVASKQIMLSVSTCEQSKEIANKGLVVARFIIVI